MASPNISAGVAAKSKSFQAGVVTTNLLKSLTGGKKLS